jgi:arylsulfatase A-like enzyme
VQNLDVVPTVLELLGLPAISGAEGRSLAPLAGGEKKGGSALAFAMQDVYRSAADERFKVILDLRQRRRTRFFDLVEDPGETRNLLGRERPAFRDLYGALQRQLEATEGAVGQRGAIEAARERMRQLRALGYL